MLSEAANSKCLLRQQIEVFEAGKDDVEGNAQGRNKPTVMGQVGIRCRHSSERELVDWFTIQRNLVASTRLLKTLQGRIYVIIVHWYPVVKEILQELRSDPKSISGAGKRY